MRDQLVALSLRLAPVRRSAILAAAAIADSALSLPVLRKSLGTIAAEVGRSRQALSRDLAQLRAAGALSWQSEQLPHRARRSPNRYNLSAQFLASHRWSRQRLPRSLLRRRDLSASSKLLLAVLHDRAWRTQEQLGVELGLSRRQVSRLVRQLERRGLLRVVRRGPRPAAYELLYEPRLRPHGEYRDLAPGLPAPPRGLWRARRSLAALRPSG